MCPCIHVPSPPDPTVCCRTSALTLNMIASTALSSSSRFSTPTAKDEVALVAASWYSDSAPSQLACHHQAPPINHQPPPATRHPSSARRPRHSQSTTYHPPPITRNPPPSLRHTPRRDTHTSRQPPPVTHHPSRQPQGAATSRRQPPVASSQPPPAATHHKPLTNIRNMLSARCHQPTATATSWRRLGPPLRFRVAPSRRCLSDASLLGLAKSEGGRGRTKGCATHCGGGGRCAAPFSATLPQLAAGAEGDDLQGQRNPPCDDRRRRALPYPRGVIRWGAR